MAWAGVVVTISRELEPGPCCPGSSLAGQVDAGHAGLRQDLVHRSASPGEPLIKTANLFLINAAPAPKGWVQARFAVPLG